MCTTCHLKLSPTCDLVADFWHQLRAYLVPQRKDRLLHVLVTLLHTGARTGMWASYDSISHVHQSKKICEEGGPYS